MSGTLAILSLLHEGAASNSGTRTFRARPVLAWTLDRLARSRKVNGTLIVCWDDQRPSTESAAPDTPIFSQPRTGIPQLDQITTAQLSSLRRSLPPRFDRWGRPQQPDATPASWRISHRYHM